MAFFLNKLLVHRAEFSVLVFLQRQEQAVGQTDVDMYKSKHKQITPSTPWGGEQVGVQKTMRFWVLTRTVNKLAVI